MKNGLPAFRIFLNLMSLPFCLPNLAVGATADPLAVAAVVRKADADWAAAAGTASVGNWMSFYAADAIVLLPNEQLASGQEPVRRAVSRLLALTHLSIAWHPIDASVARSGDLAFLVEAYELRFDDSRGAPVSDRGRRLEIWRRQIDGSWKCFGTWTHPLRRSRRLRSRSPRLQRLRLRAQLQLRIPDRRRRFTWRLRNTVTCLQITRRRLESTF